MRRITQAGLTSDAYLVVWNAIRERGLEIELESGKVLVLDFCIDPDALPATLEERRAGCDSERR